MPNTVNESAKTALRRREEGSKEESGNFKVFFLHSENFKLGNLN